MEILEKTNKTISTIAIRWPVSTTFKKRAATVEVDTFIFPEFLVGFKQMGQDYYQTYARTRVERRFFSRPFFAPNTGNMQKMARNGTSVCLRESR